MALVDTITSLLDAYGVEVSLQKRVVSAHSPVSDTVLATNTSQTARCVVVNKADARSGDNDARNVSRVSLFFGSSPSVEIGDRFQLSGKTHAIETVGEIQFAGSIVGYKVTATR